MSKFFEGQYVTIGGDDEFTFIGERITSYGSHAADVRGRDGRVHTVHIDQVKAV